jgi:hypothetical protein
MSNHGKFPGVAAPNCAAAPTCVIVPVPVSDSILKSTTVVVVVNMTISAVALAAVRAVLPGGKTVSNDPIAVAVVWLYHPNAATAVAALTMNDVVLAISL